MSVGTVFFKEILFLASVMFMTIHCHFIVLQEDVDEFMKKPDSENAETVLRSLEEQHSKYKFMEYNLITKKSRYITCQTSGA